MNNIYINSKGEKLEMDKMNTEHILNAMTKKMRDVFSAKNKDEAFKMIEEVNNLKEETFKRINTFIETLGEDNAK